MIFVADLAYILIFAWDTCVIYAADVAEPTRSN